MCGIVGLVTPKHNGLTVAEMNVFSDMLFVDTLRGWDSTGVFGVTHTANVWMAKDAVHAPDFLKTKEYGDWKAEMIARGKFVVGHNRAATRGAVKDVNAHPFIVDDKIVLVQNGSYKGSHHHLKATEVDTEAVAHTIAEADSVETALQKVNASYALVWYNADTKQLHFIRNSERPLWFAGYETTGVLFASEATTILYAAGRHNLKMDELPVELEPYTHVVLTLDGKGGYTKEVNKINAAYVSTRVDYGITRHSFYENEFVDPFPRNPLALAYDHRAGRHHGRGGNQEIQYTFHDEIFARHQELLFASEEDARKAEGCSQRASAGEKLYVETYDYLPANDHADCAAWHVYGFVLDPHIDSEQPHTLVHWIVYDKSERDIVEYCTNAFWIVNPSTYQIRSVSYNGVKKYMSSVYALKVEELTSSHVEN